ncbi:hypothetical protein B0H13DRAFT_1857519 [Mycena leptocephala]|nr:hypothetical protein B0H13DRAFT_1857519 [Mycena leptocephala]
MVGRGASGTVWRSSDGSEVAKVFVDPELALHEAAVLERARTLSVPPYRGVVSGQKRTGVIMSYQGTPIGNIEQATDEQKQQLARTLKSLHEIGIHHHDVRGENVLVDERGALTLIDFHQPQFVEVERICYGCPDTQLNSCFQIRLYERKEPGVFILSEPNNLGMPEMIGRLRTLTQMAVRRGTNRCRNVRQLCLESLLDGRWRCIDDRKHNDGGGAGNEGRVAFGAIFVHEVMSSGYNGG